MDVDSSPSLTRHDAVAHQRRLSSSSPAASSSPPPQFDSVIPTRSQFFYFYHTINPSTASLTSNVLGPNLSTTFTHSRAPALFSQATILTNLTKKTTGFLAFLPSSDSRTRQTRSQTRTILAWAESGHGHGPEGDLLDGNPSVLSNALWAKRVIKLSSIMGLNLGHPFDRLTRGGQQGIFRASHVEVKLATHAIYALLRVFDIPHRGEAMTTRTLEKLRCRLGQAGESANNDAAADGNGDGGGYEDRLSRPSFEIYFSKKNCHACAQYVARLGALTGVDMTLCWKERLVQIEYDVTRMGEPRLQRQVDGEAHGIITVEDDEDTRMLDAVDLTEEEVGAGTTDGSRHDEAMRLDMFLEGLAYCIGQGRRANVVKAVVSLAGIYQRRRPRNMRTKTARRTNGESEMRSSGQGAPSVCRRA